MLDGQQIEDMKEQLNLEAATTAELEGAQRARIELLSTLNKMQITSIEYSPWGEQEVTITIKGHDISS